jgi:hypothetical protein
MAHTDVHHEEQAMTDAEICKAVAELAGWKNVRFTVPPNEHPSFVYGQDPQDDPNDSWYDEHFRDERVPDFPNSLDAIVPVVREWCKTKGSDCDWGIAYDAHNGPSAFVDDPYVATIDDSPARAACLALIEANAAMSKKGYDHFPAKRDETETR